MGGSWQSSQQRTYSQDCSFKDSLYRVGDYVYVEPAETNLQPHIIYIERLWQDNTGEFLRSHTVTSVRKVELTCLFPTPSINAGEKWLYGCWFYRPNETFHLATRKFLEKEVFKSDYYNKAPLSKILGKCVVMFVKVNVVFSYEFGCFEFICSEQKAVAFQEYFKLYPEGFRAEDVYVCESRYSAKSKSFKKIKMWAMPLSSVRFVPRDMPLPVVRVASIFASKQEEKPAEIAYESKLLDGIIDKVRSCLFQLILCLSENKLFSIRFYF